MISRFFAAWLVVLTTVPFTAPFSTCDLTALLGRTHAPHRPFAPPASTAAANQPAVPIVPTISRAGRVRMVPRIGVPLAQNRVGAASAKLLAPRASTRVDRRQSVLLSILRL